MLNEGIPVQIIAGTLDLSATASRRLSIERSEHLEMWVGERLRPPAETSAGGTPPADRFLSARPEVAADGGLGALLEQAAKAKREQGATDGGDEDALDPQLAKVLLLLEKLFGMKGIRQTALRLPTQDGGVAVAPGAVAPVAGQAQAADGCPQSFPAISVNPVPFRSPLNKREALLIRNELGHLIGINGVFPMLATHPDQPSLSC